MTKNIIILQPSDVPPPPPPSTSYVDKPLYPHAPFTEKQLQYHILHEIFYDLFLSTVVELEMAKQGVVHQGMDLGKTAEETGNVIKMIFETIVTSAVQSAAFNHRFGLQLLEFEHDTGLRLSCISVEMSLVAQVIYERDPFDISLSCNDDSDETRQACFTIASEFYRDVISANMIEMMDTWGIYCVNNGCSCAGASYKDIYEEIGVTEEEKDNNWF